MLERMLGEVQNLTLEERRQLMGALHAAAAGQVLPAVRRLRFQSVGDFAVEGGRSDAPVGCERGRAPLGEIL